MQRYKIEVEYCGTNYCGFQKQFLPNKKSVEEVLTKSIFQFCGQEIPIFASGRTDAGVHAIDQVVHFDLAKIFQNHQVALGLNHYLKQSQEDVVVKSCQLVSSQFHSRFSAKMRHYRYIVLNRLAPPILEKNRVWHISKTIDLEKMRLASAFLIGEYDFSSFRDQECQAKSPIRTIEAISIINEGEKIFFDVSAKSFLHHMVRNIVGTLIYVGIGKIMAEKIPEILAAKNRQLSGPNAPACGLYFLRTDY